MNQPFTTLDQRWTAITQRDRCADGVFFYAVKTTGVYCRPSCASRQPNRENVFFYASGNDAEKAGYRACKRCNPDTTSVEIPESVVQACRLIDAANEPPVLKKLAAAVGLSPYYLHRLFKAVVGVTPRGYAATRRVEKLKQTLRHERTVASALYNAGYGSGSRLYEAASGTATYADIARTIGNPAAVRAVGRACAANPVAVAIPCHRVVGSDGNLTGFRWGIERKQALLDIEIQISPESERLPHVHLDW